MIRNLFPSRSSLPVRESCLIAPISSLLDPASGKQQDKWLTRNSFPAKVRPLLILCCLIIGLSVLFIPPSVSAQGTATILDLGANGGRKQHRIRNQQFRPGSWIFLGCLGT